MKKKKLRSALAVIMVITLLVTMSSTVLARGFQSGNQWIKLIADVPEEQKKSQKNETTSVPDEETQQADQQNRSTNSLMQKSPLSAEEQPLLTTEPEDQNTVKVKDDDVYIGPSKVENTIRSGIAAVIAGFADNFLKKWTGLDFKTVGIWNAILGKQIKGEYTQDFEKVNEKLDEISGKISRMSVQIDQATKEILGAVEKSEMVAAVGKCNDAADRIDTAYYTPFFDSNQLSYLKALEDGTYNNDRDKRETIDFWLHDLYSYSDDVISPATEQKYTNPQGSHLNFINDFLEFGNQLTGAKPLMTENDIFTLYYGIMTYTCNFNIETIDARTVLYENTFNFYEKGYGALLAAINYDKDIHQANLTEKEKTIAILEAAKSSMNTDDQKVIDSKISQMKTENTVHKAAIQAAESYAQKLQAQYDTLTTAHDQAQSRLEGDKNLNELNRVFCYRNGCYYYKTVLIQDCNYGLQENFKDNYQGHFVDCRMTGHNPETFESNNKILPPYDKEDRLRTDKKLANAAPVAELADLKTWAENRNTTLREELIRNFTCTESEANDYAEQELLSQYVNERPDIAIYINGWQSTYEEPNGTGCSAKQPYRVIKRTVRQLNSNNAFTDTDTMGKCWISGGTYDKMTTMERNEVKSFPMIILMKDPNMNIGGEGDGDTDISNVQTGAEMFDMTAAVVSGVLILLAGFMIFILAGRKRD